MIRSVLVLPFWLLLFSIMVAPLLRPHPDRLHIIWAIIYVLAFALALVGVIIRIANIRRKMDEDDLWNRRSSWLIIIAVIIDILCYYMRV